MAPSFLLPEGWNAVVTGAPGWLGSRLVEALVRGLPEVPGLAAFPRPGRVRCLVLAGQDIRALKALGPQVEAVEGDLSGRATLDALFKDLPGATVIHCAGIIHPTAGVKQFYSVNVEGAKNLLDAAAKGSARRFVHVSSNSPIGCNPRPDHLFDENAPYNPYMNYGRSKMLAEEAVKAAAGKFETVIVRPPWFYGPGQPERQATFFKMIKEGTVPIVGSGGNIRSMAYVDNLAQGLMLAAAVERAKGQIYWIADARPYSMNEIVDTIEAVLRDDFKMQVKSGRRRLPGIASEVAWLIDKTMQAAGLYHQKIHVLSEMNKNIACSVEKARRELGYDPRIELREGMRRSIQWMLDQGQKI